MSFDKNQFDRERSYWDSKTGFEWVSESGIEAVLEEIPLVHGDVLELCSGSGMFSKRLPNRYDLYASLDLSQSMLMKLRKDILGVDPVVGDAEILPISSFSFDHVLVFAGLHHLQNEGKAKGNAYRVLRPGGVFFAFEPNAACWYRKPMLWFKGILNLYTEDERFLFPEAVKEYMEDAGFVDIEIKYLTPEYNPNHLGTALGRLLSVLMKMAASISQGSSWQSFFIITGKK